MASVRSRVIAALLCLPLTAPAALAEEDPGRAAARLERIRSDVVAAEQDIAKVEGEFDQLVAKRSEVTETLRRLKREDQDLERRLLEVEEQRKELEGRVREAEERVRRERERNGSRLRALYVQSAVSEPPILARGAERGNRELISAYSRSVREGDARRLAALRAAVAELVQARASLEEAVQEAQALRVDIRQMREEAERRQKELQRLVREIQSRKEAAQRSIAALKEEARDLERIIAALTTGAGSGRSEAAEDEDADEAEAGGEERLEVNAVTQEAQQQGQPAQAPRPPQGGLFVARASLSAPVRGEVVQHFGKVKLASFKDVLFSKGVEFSSEDNGPVHAVLAGTVAYAGVLPGYDNVVIIDHGARSYSLHGRLGKTLVSKGETVGQDTVVGTTSVADKRGRNFYFEVRRSGEPVDPEAVLPRISR